jgi:two-component system chemotaxis sensor kinase CheA
MIPDDEAYQALCVTLREEAAEQVERIGAALLEIERGVGDERLVTLLEQSFREAHNLKGAAGSLGFSLTSSLAHAIESVLGKLRKVDPRNSLEAFDLLHQGLSVVDRALALGPQVSADPTVTPLIEKLERYQLASPAPPRPTADPKATRTLEGQDHEQPLEDRETEPPVVGEHAPAPVEPRAQLGLPVPTAPEPRLARPAATAAVEATRPTRQTPQGTRTGQAERARLKPTKAASPTPGRPEDNLRVSMRKLNALMAQVGELLAARLRTDQRLAELRSLLGSEEELLDQRTVLLSALRDRRPVQLDSYSGQLLETFEEDVSQRKQLVRELRVLVRAFEADALQSTILSGELQEDIRRIQTFPLASVLDPLPRAVRNLAREAGKDAILRIEGAELELDKKVLEALKDPLNHLLRNAVDHGIEAPDLRQRAGKPSHGTIVIRAEHRGDSIVITTGDDGPGVDLEAVRQHGLERGLLSPEQAESAPEQKLLELLFAPGLTTRARASSVSGRGVGLDAVRTNIEELQGVISVDSQPGQGTVFTIVLPLTIYVVHALLLRVGAHQLAMPISSIRRILRVKPAEVLTVEQSEAVLVEGRPLALISLGSLLGVESEDDAERERIPVLVVGTGEARCALAVDEIVGDQTVLAKHFEPPLMRVKNFAGATIRGDGSVLLMLNPIDLLRSANAHQFSRSGQLARRLDVDQRQPRVLLVDDSLTTRSLERSVFELAGFEVVAAADGEEALQALNADEPFDVIVSDVSMPGISGFELCERVRQSERHRTVPLVLVTALASAEDRRRGLEAGADAYIAKQEFDHEVLVAKVSELMGRG